MQARSPSRKIGFPHRHGCRHVVHPVEPKGKRQKLEAAHEHNALRSFPHVPTPGAPQHLAHQQYNTSEPKETADNSQALMCAHPPEKPFDHSPSTSHLRYVLARRLCLSEDTAQRIQKKRASPFTFGASADKNSLRLVQSNTSTPIPGVEGLIRLYGPSACLAERSITRSTRQLVCFRGWSCETLIRIGTMASHQQTRTPLLALPAGTQPTSKSHWLASYFLKRHPAVLGNTAYALGYATAYKGRCGFRHQPRNVMRTTRRVSIRKTLRELPGGTIEA